MLLLSCLLLLIAAGFLYANAGAFLDARRFPPPGRLVTTSKRRLHLNEQGSGHPIVVFESGLAASSLSWALVQPSIAEFAHVCSYDRAGLGWSDKLSSVPTVQEIVSELSEVLTRAALAPPYILVAHSFGALVVRAFAFSRPDQVSGVVLVDPVSPELWANCNAEDRKRLRLGLQLSRRGAQLARIGLVRAALAALIAGGRRFPKLMSRAAGGEGSRFLSRMIGEVQKLPPVLWPIVRAHWSRPQCFRAMAAYLESLPAIAQAALQMPIPSSIALTVLSASASTDSELAERDTWVAQTMRGRHIRVPESGHWLQLERPDLVIGAVRDLIAYVNKSQ